MNDMLVVAPHPDDESLGAGGTIATLVGGGARVTVLTLAGHLPPLYESGVYEKTLSEAAIAHSILGVSESIFVGIPALHLANLRAYELNSHIESVIKAIKPEVVLLPFADRHEDHRKVLEAGLVACRPVGSGRYIRAVLCYETPSETHWNAAGIESSFTATSFVDISKYLSAKLAACKAYESQVNELHSARSLEAVEALSAFRGSQFGVRHAEAFHTLRADMGKMLGMT